MVSAVDTAPTPAVEPASDAVVDDRRHRPRDLRTHWGALTAVVLGAVLRGAWLVYARPEPVSDFRHYRQAALALLDSGVFGVGHPSAWRLPAYPVVLAAGALAGRDTFTLSVVTVGIAVAQVALTYWVAWRIFASRPAATLAALVAAVVPAFVAYAPVLASEHLLAALVLAAVGVALGPVPGPRIWPGALLAGVLLGAATLTRGEALAYLPVLALVAAAGGWRRDRRIAPALGAATVMVLGLLLVITPWVVRNERVVGPGAGLSTTGGFNFYLAHSPGAYGWRTPLPLPLLVDDEVTRNELGWRYGLGYVRRHPWDWVQAARLGTRELLAPSTYAARYATVRVDPVRRRLVPRDDLTLRPAALDLAATGSRWLLWAGLAGLAILGMWTRRGWFALVGIAVANWMVYAVVFWAQARYRYVIDALACVSVGALVGAVPAWRPRRLNRTHRPRTSAARIERS